MKNILFILFLLPAVFAVQPATAATPAGLQPPDWRVMPWAVPATEKEGHSWMVEYDNIENTKLYTGIAVALVNNEVLFARYNPLLDSDVKEGCASFHTPRGSKTVCNGQFFLLHENFAKLIRVPVTAENVKEPCPKDTKPVEYKHYRLIMDKPSGHKKIADNFKHIGTYFTTRDQVSYFRYNDGAPELIQRFANSTEITIEGRFETLCRQNYVEENSTSKKKSWKSK